MKTFHIVSSFYLFLGTVAFANETNFVSSRIVNLPVTEVKAVVQSFCCDRTKHPDLFAWFISSPPNGITFLHRDTPWITRQKSNLTATRPKTEAPELQYELFVGDCAGPAPGNTVILTTSVTATNTRVELRSNFSPRTPQEARFVTNYISRLANEITELQNTK